MSSAFCSPITNCSLRQAPSRSRSLKGILEHCSRLLSYLSHSGTKKKLTKLSLAFSHHLIVSGCMDRKLKCTVSAVILLKVVIKMFIIVVSIKQWCELSSAWPGDFTAFHYRLQMSPEWFNATWNHQTLPEKTTNLNCFLGLKKIWHPFQRFFPARVEWKWFMSENLAETTTTLSGDSLNVLRWKPTRIILSIS